MADKNDILLKEYEMCQAHNDSIGSQVWVSTTIFLSINVTLLGGLLYTLLTVGAFGIIDIENLKKICQFQVLGPRIAVTALGIGIMVILCRWKQWLKRMRFHTAVNFQRMGTIEHTLGMCRHTISRRLDQAFEHRKNWTPEQKKNFEGKRGFWQYSPASGFKGLICIAYTLTVLWALSIVYVWFPVILVFVKLLRG